MLLWRTLARQSIPLLLLPRTALPLFTRPPAIATSTVTRTFTTSIMSKSSQAFIEAVKTRRSVYQLSKDSPIPDSKIEEIVKDAILHTPTSLSVVICNPLPLQILMTVCIP